MRLEWLGELRVHTGKLVTTFQEVAAEAMDSVH